MTIEAMKQALDRVVKAIDEPNNTMSDAKALKEIMRQLRLIHATLRTAIEQAEKQEAWKTNDTAYRPGGLPQDFIVHEVENEGDWSEWVNPNSEQYFMKCCDCGLVHEMQFKVVKYSEGDECEFVADADLQAVFRARRVETADLYTTPPAQEFVCSTGLCRFTLTQTNVGIGEKK